MTQKLAMFADAEPWRQVTKWNTQAVALADRHYSRQSPGSSQFLPPGRTLVLLTGDASAVWAAVENLDPAGTRRFRCTIFRNEGDTLSSALVASATVLTQERWARRWGWSGSPPFQTEIDPSRTRRKRDPGRCFLRAGWWRVDERRGLVVLQAPPPAVARAVKRALGIVPAVEVTP